MALFNCSVYTVLSAGCNGSPILSEIFQFFSHHEIWLCHTRHTEIMFLFEVILGLEGKLR